jgi:hypothetical protein
VRQTDRTGLDAVLAARTVRQTHRTCLDAVLAARTVRQADRTCLDAVLAARTVRQTHRTCLDAVLAARTVRQADRTRPARPRLEGRVPTPVSRTGAAERSRHAPARALDTPSGSDAGAGGEACRRRIDEQSLGVDVCEHDRGDAHAHALSLHLVHARTERRPEPAERTTPFVWSIAFSGTFATSTTPVRMQVTTRARETPAAPCATSVPARRRDVALGGAMRQ